MLHAFMAALVASGLAASPEPHLEVKKLTYNGTGCPLGTLGTSADPDAPQRMALTLSAMNVDWAKGFEPSRSRRNCVISVDYKVPEGWQLAISHVGMRGVVDLSSANMEAIVSSRIGFLGQQATTVTHEEHLQGPLRKDFDSHSWPQTLAWSKCGGPQTLFINYMVRVKPLVSNPDEKAWGSLTLNYDLSEATQVIDYVWQRC